jgi:sterol desaturase/sphingolipid hydroxylase (fatty acid hydroxylase superfamily)
VRVHPLDAAIAGPFNVLPGAVLGVSPGVMLAYALASMFHEILVHLDMAWPDWLIFRWLFCSPQAHKLHHSSEPSHYDRNFCFMPLWDRLFGTWSDPRGANPRLGFVDGIHNTGRPARTMFRVYRDWVKGLAK